MPSDRRFPAMGARARIWIVGGPDTLADRLVSRIEELEQRWSRFIESSDTCRMNRECGQPVRVHADTIDLVRHALAAAAKTDRRFDPTMGREIVDAGYHVPFDQVIQEPGDFVTSTDGGLRAFPARRSDRGVARDIVVDREASTVTVPQGVAFDPGGIGKGRAADLAAEDALFCGADSVFVDIGGDVRMAGEPPGGGWPLYVDDPRGGPDPLVTLRLPSCGVATSSARRRRWVTASGPQHHLLDPRTGSPSTSDLMALTVVSSEAWWAEAISTAGAVSGREAAIRLLEESDSTGLWVTADGELEHSAGLGHCLVG